MRLAVMILCLVPCVAVAQEKPKVRSLADYLSNAKSDQALQKLIEGHWNNASQFHPVSKQWFDEPGGITYNADGTVTVVREGKKVTPTEYRWFVQHGRFCNVLKAGMEPYCMPVREADGALVFSSNKISQDYIWLQNKAEFSMTLEELQKQ